MAGFSVANLFRPTQQVTQAPTPPNSDTDTGFNQGPAGGPPNQSGPQNAPGSSMQQRQGMESSGQNSPLAPFEKLWETPDTGSNGAPKDPFSEPLFATDPVKIKEAASQMDFVAQLPQELVQKAMSGQDPQAFMQVINGVAQAALATALQVSTGTMEQAGTKLGQRFKSALPDSIRDVQVNSQVSSNPILNNPAVQPMLKMARNQIKMMNPGMSPQDIQQQAEQLFLSMAKEMIGADPASQPPVDPSKKTTDWDTWLS